jgi:hypothetical protein
LIGTGDEKQVYDHQNQQNKKPHWKHIHLFDAINSNNGPSAGWKQKKIKMNFCLRHDWGNQKRYSIDFYLIFLSIFQAGTNFLNV